MALIVAVFLSAAFGAKVSSFVLDVRLTHPSRHTKAWFLLGRQSQRNQNQQTLDLAGLFQRRDGYLCAASLDEICRPEMSDRCTGLRTSDWNQYPSRSSSDAAEQFDTNTRFRGEYVHWQIVLGDDG